MDIFESTLDLKKYIVDNNPQLIKINGVLEMSGMSPLPILNYYDKDIREYDALTTVIQSNFLFNPEVKICHRQIKPESGLDFIWRYEDLTPLTIDTKEYWQFLHENFRFCDVSSYYRINDLATYFEIKGKHYIAIINKLGAETFRGKRILEIGPGYGFLPQYLKQNDIDCEYFCADIVRRFDHDGFIDVNGYTLSNISDKFDVVIMQDVIQHLGKNIFRTYGAEIMTMLNDDGKLIIGTELRSQQDHAFTFFGQITHSFGLENLNLYMCNYLGYEFRWEYMELDGLRWGHILIYSKKQ